VILALDVGNSQLFGGVFEDGQLRFQFRRSSHPNSASDELGVFLRSVLRENSVDPGLVDRIAICSVVPEMLYSLRSCCRKYFAVDPFVLQAGARTGLKILYRNPAEVGPDRIATAIAAVGLYPNKNLMVIDFGTATTINVISAKREYLGGAILPGMRIAMEALEKNTARLPTVEIVPPHDIIGRSTIESIQSGLFFGTRAMVLGLTRELRKAAFGAESATTIGTGGFARLFEREKMFDALVPDLVLLGLHHALEMNADGSRRWTPQEMEPDH
jgi:type III pantothenate kinase